LIITKTQARKIWTEQVHPEIVDYAVMERFFDEATDEALYNVCIHGDNTDRSTDEGLVSDYVRRYLEDNPSKRPGSLGEQNIAYATENRILRELLAIRVSGMAGLYADDGELQDNSVFPAIDFKRDTAQEIRRKLRERGERQLQATGVVLP
jgi:hypothetical protein